MADIPLVAIKWSWGCCLLVRWRFNADCSSPSSSCEFYLTDVQGPDQTTWLFVIYLLVIDQSIKVKFYIVVMYVRSTKVRKTQCTSVRLLLNDNAEELKKITIPRKKLRRWWWTPIRQNGDSLKLLRPAINFTIIGHNTGHKPKAS